MLHDSFWSVDLGVGVGPLVLGQPRTEVVRVLRNHLSGEVDAAEVEEWLELDENEIYIDTIQTTLVFSENAPHVLKRIESEDERLRFGSMPVIGKPIHEVVALLNVPSSETLWCSTFDDEMPNGTAQKDIQNRSDRELLVAGTLWITTLGLGMSLRRGKIGTLHLCQPDDSPRSGTGTWNDNQKALSESGFEFIASISSARRSVTDRILSAFLFVGLIGASIYVIWQGAMLQQAWNNQPDVQATVIAIAPPPPQPFPETYTVKYLDHLEVERQATFRAEDVYGVHEMGSDIPIRFLRDAPEKPLTYARFDDIGFSFAVPRCLALGIAYLAISSVIALLRYLVAISKRYL